MLNFKEMYFPINVILACICWYAAYSLSYRHLEEMMGERGVSVDHSTINSWAIRFLPLTEKMAGKHKRRVGACWRMDKTYMQCPSPGRAANKRVGARPEWTCHFSRRRQRDKTSLQIANLLYPGET